MISVSRLAGRRVALALLLAMAASTRAEPACDPQAPVTLRLLDNRTRPGDPTILPGDRLAWRLEACNPGPQDCRFGQLLNRLATLLQPGASLLVTAIEAYCVPGTPKPGCTPAQDCYNDGSSAFGANVQTSWLPGETTAVEYEATIPLGVQGQFCEQAEGRPFGPSRNGPGLAFDGPFLPGDPDTLHSGTSSCFIVAPTGLRAEIHSAAADIRPADVITYQARVWNEGASALAQVRLTGRLPLGADRAASCAALSVAAVPVPAGFAVDRTTCAASGTYAVSWDGIAPGESVSLDIGGIAYTQRGQIDRNWAITSLDASSASGAAGEVTWPLEIFWPELQGSSSLNGLPYRVSIGQYMQWRAVIANTGRAPATDAELTVDFEAPGCFDGASTRLLAAASDPACQYDPGTGQLRAAYTSLAPGERHTCWLESLALRDGACLVVGYARSHETIELRMSTIVNIDVALKPDFRGSTKTFAPQNPAAGDPITFSIDVRNRDARATGVLLSDVFDSSCFDVAGFCPDPADCSSQVGVSPGPSGTPTFDPALRRLTVPLLTMLATDAQTVTITGIRAAAAGSTCCNRAFIGSTELGMIAHSTDDPRTAEPGDPSCIAAAPASALLLRNGEWPLAGLAAIFSGPHPCGPAALDPATTLDPSGADCTPLPGEPDDDDLLVTGFVSGQDDPTPGIVTDATRPLVVYQVDRDPPVGNGLRLVRRAAGSLRIEAP